MLSGDEGLYAVPDFERAWSCNIRDSDVQTGYIPAVSRCNKFTTSMYVRMYLASGATVVKTCLLKTAATLNTVQFRDEKPLQMIMMFI